MMIYYYYCFLAFFFNLFRWFLTDCGTTLGPLPSIPGGLCVTLSTTGLFEETVTSCIIFFAYCSAFFACVSINCLWRL